MHRRLSAGSVGVVGLACALLVVAGCGAETTTETATSPSSKPPVAVPASPEPTHAGKQGRSTAPEGDGELVPEGLQTGAPVDELGTTGGRRIFGADYSWPQCPKGMGIPEKRSHGAPMPTDAARFVIIGLTNGPSFTPNPCLGDQVAWARQRKLLAAAYAVVSWPSQRTVDELGAQGPFGSSRLDRLRNVGHRAAGYTIREMRRADLPSPMVWVDVEPVNDFAWSGTTQEQAAVVEGTIRGYTDAGLRVGIYSTPAMYAAIVGERTFGLPEWRAAGQTSMREALHRCGEDWSIQGGEAFFGQWVEDGRDRNVTCPGVDLRLREYFHQF